MRNSQLIKIDGREYYEIEIISINQKNRSFYVAKVDADHLISVYTVKPVEYDIEILSALAKEYPSEKSYYEALVEEKQSEEYPDEWQRPENKDRVRDIKNYLNEKEFCFFPNTIIVTCELVNSFDESWERIDIASHAKSSSSIFSYYTEKEGSSYIVVPKKRGAILIVDGQHRVRGLQESSQSENYELLLSFLIGYDRSVVANQFYTINYNQKPVNKSLLYQLTSQFSKELTEVTFFHNVLKALNEVDKSPFYKRIKMLGVAPKPGTMIDEDRALMTISQAFFIDYMTPTIGKRAVRGYAQPIFRYYYNIPEKQSIIVQFLKRYFNGVRLEFKEQWNNPQISIISKTLGVAAFIKVLPLIYIKLFFSEWRENPDNAQNIKSKDFKKIFETIDKNLFLRTGPYGGTTSAGSVSKLRDDIVQQIDILKNEDLDSLLDKYKKWFSEKVSQ